MTEAPGFARLEQQVDLPPGGSVALDLKLQVGKLSETVEVSATAVAVNTENQTVGQQITSNDITNLPLLTRNPYDLVGGAANASSAADVGLTMRGAGYNINGLRAAGTNILLDGAANNDEFTASVGCWPISMQIPINPVRRSRNSNCSLSLIQTVSIWTAYVRCFRFFANAQLHRLCLPLNLVDEA